MMDLHELDVRINNAGEGLAGVSRALGALIRDKLLTLSQAQPLLESMFGMNDDLVMIQQWSTDAQKPPVTLYEGLPVTRNPDGTLTWNGLRYASEMDIAAGKPVGGTPPVPEKLPRLTGTQFDRIVAEARTGHPDASLEAELGTDLHNNYKNYAYGPGGYYWLDVLNAPK